MSVTIEQCAAARACKEGLKWARAQKWPGGVVDMDALRVRDLDWFRWVVRCVAGPEMLTELAGDADWRVRWAVAQNRNCPVEVLAKLAGDADWYVLWAVAQNRNCPVEVLTKLAGDDDCDVREVAKARLEEVQG